MFDPIEGVGAFAQAGSNIYAANQNYKAQQETNATNIQLADKAMAFNDQQATRQMAFQERMSNSAYQRATDDMRKAGVNPMLAVQNGGASSPSGSAGSGIAARIDAPRPGDVVSSGVSGAFQGYKAIKDLESIDAGIAQQKASALASVANANNANASAKATEAGMPSIQGRAKSANAEADQKIAEAKAGQTQAEISQKWATYDAVVSRIIQAIGGASSAVNIGNLLQRKGIDRDNHILNMQKGVPLK